MEEYSAGKVHKEEPDPRNRNVNIVYFIHQAMGNTRISRTEFVYDERAYDCKSFLIFELPAYNNVRKKIYFYKLAFTRNITSYCENISIGNHMISSAIWNK